MSRNINRNKTFDFKHFSLSNDISAMKISTDGVLLGVWTDVLNKKQILDVGTGTGLIALMLAQRCDNALITAIDIDENAFREATLNVEKSPWKGRVNVQHCDFKQFSSDEKFDLIVSNPPYFNNGIKAPDSSRATARHDDTLEYSDIISAAKSLLTENGSISLIAPADRLDDISSDATVNGFKINKITTRFNKPKSRPIRILIELGKEEKNSVSDTLYIRNEDNQYSQQYKTLTKDFYINF